MNIANIGVGVYADLAKLHSGLQAGQSAVAVFAGAAATAFASVATAAIAAGLAVDDALDGIRISTGATGAAMAGLEDSFSRVFANVPSSAGDASAAIAQLNVRTGQTGAGLEALSTQVLTLARITKSDLNATVSDSAKVFTSWGIEVGKQASTLDMVFRASQQTGIGVGALLQTMVTAGPVFRAAGFDFATSAALLGSFEKAGVNGQRAVASLTAAFRFFGKEGIDAKKGVADTIARIQELGPGAASAALGVKVFGRSAVDMVAAIQSGRLNVDALVASIANGTDTIASAAQATDGFTETLAKLRNNAVLALEPFGTAILGTFNAAMVGLLKPSRALLTTLDVLAKVAIALAVAVGTRMVVAFARSTAAKAADFFATQAALRANAQFTGAVARQTQAQFVAATAQLNAARAAGTGTAAIIAQRNALVAVRTAQVQAAAATAAHTAAMNAASISARLAAGSLNLLKGVLAFFGGPIGLAITAVLTIVGIAFYNTGKKAREAAADARQAADDFRNALVGMQDATLTATFVNSGYTRSAIVGQIQSNTAQMAAQRAEIQRLNDAGVQMPTQTLSGNAFVSDQQAALIRHTEALEHNRRALEVLRAEERKYGAQVSEASTELENRRRVLREMNATLETPATGALAWEGASAKAATAANQTYSGALRGRATLFAEIFEAERAQGRDTESIMGELNRIYEDAATRLRAMGDATLLPEEALKDYREFAGILQQLSAANLAGPATVRQAPALARPAAIRAVEQGMTITITTSSVERFSQITKASAADFGATVVQKMQQGRDAVKSGMVEGAKEAAETLKQASDNVRAMWAGLLSGLPQQLGNFASMFDSLRKRRIEQEKDADGNGVGATGLAPFPSAVAFMLAAEALAPVLEAIRVPMAALMVPLQMATAAFGPLLTTVIKALFPVMKVFGIAVTYVAQIASTVAGALLKVVGEIIRTVGSLIAKIPGLGEEGAAIKKFGKGLTDSAKEMFDLAASMPGVRDELRNLDWDEAMKRASDSANKLADSLTNVPEVFDLIARQTQAMRGQGPQSNPPPLRQQVSVDVPDVLAVSASVANAAAMAGTTAAKSITSEAVRWKEALIQGAEQASSTLRNTAVSIREALAGIMPNRVRVTGEAVQAQGGTGNGSGPQSLLMAQIAALSSILAAQNERNTGYRVADYSSPPAPNPSSQTSSTTNVQTPVTVNVTFSPTVNGGGDKREIEALLRQERERLIRDLKAPGTNGLQAAVVEFMRGASRA